MQNQDHITIGSRIVIHDESATTIMLTINDVIEIELTPNVVKKLADQLETTANIATFLERYRLMHVSHGSNIEDIGELLRELLKFMGGFHENSKTISKRT